MRSILFFQKMWNLFFAFCLVVYILEVVEGFHFKSAPFLIDKHNNDGVMRVKLSLISSPLSISQYQANPLSSSTVKRFIHSNPQGGTTSRQHSRLDSTNFGYSNFDDENDFVSSSSSSLKNRSPISTKGIPAQRNDQHDMIEKGRPSSVKQQVSRAGKIDDMDDDKHQQEKKPSRKDSNNPPVSMGPRYKPQRVSINHQKEGEKLINAITWFVDRYGKDYPVPYTYVIPHIFKDSDGDERANDPELVGYPLGERMSHVRKRGQWVKAPFDKQLMELGVIPPTSHLQALYSAEDIDIALKLYKEQIGSLDIPLDYKLNQWQASCPESMKGAPLGQIVDAIRRRALYFNPTDMRLRWSPLGIRIIADAIHHGHNGELTKPGSVTASKAPVLISALRHYKAIYGDTMVPKKYIINRQETPSFPKHLDGYKLGQTLVTLRSRATNTHPPYFEQLVELEVIPPVYEEFARKYSATDIEEALQDYLSHHGHLVIPFDYKIPNNQGGSLARLRGAPLGELLDAIQSRRLYFNSLDVRTRWRKLGILFNQAY